MRDYFTVANGLLFFVSFTTYSVLGVRDTEPFDLEGAAPILHAASPNNGSRPECVRYPPFNNIAIGCDLKHCPCRFYERCKDNACFISWWFFLVLSITVVGTLTVASIVWSAQDEQSAEEFVEAAWYIRDAIDGIQRVHPRNTYFARRCYAFHIRHVPTLHFYAIVFLLLAIIERPQWCQIATKERPDEVLCESALYPTFPIPYLSYENHLTIESVLLVPFILDAFASGLAQGGYFWSSRRQTMRAIALSVNFLEVIRTWCTPPDYIRFGHYLRLWFLLDHSHTIRRCFQLVLRILPIFRTIILLIFSYVAMFAFVGCVLFPKGTAQGDEMFKDFGETMWHLLVTLTTANYPDVMMPAYRENRFAYIFFWTFIVFGCFFLVNLTTASVCSAYNEQNEFDEKQRAELEAECIGRAYDIISAGSIVAREKVGRFFDKIGGHCPSLRYIGYETSREIISHFDLDGNDVLTKKEFSEIFLALKRRGQRSFRPPWLEEFFPGIEIHPCYIAIKRFVQSSTLDTIVNTTVICSFGLMILDHWEALRGEPYKEDVTSRLRVILEWPFCVFYMFEMLLKVSLLGLPRFWSKLQNQFDFWCTALTFTLLMAKEFTDMELNDTFISLARLPRILIFLIRFPAFREITETFLEMLSDRIASVTGFLLCTMYLFSILGCHLFGGVITLDERSPYHAKVKDSDFGKAEYWENNFNDVPSGMVTLFELLVVNNWQVIASGFSAACGVHALFFFIAFYIIGVLVIFNIVLAIILDNFHKSYQKGSKLPSSNSSKPDGNVPVLSAEERIHIRDEILRNLGVDPLEIERTAAAAKAIQLENDE